MNTKILPRTIGKVEYIQHLGIESEIPSLNTDTTWMKRLILFVKIEGKEYQIEVNPVAMMGKTYDLSRSYVTENDVLVDFKKQIEILSEIAKHYEFFVRMVFDLVLERQDDVSKDPIFHADIKNVTVTEDKVLGHVSIDINGVLVHEGTYDTFDSDIIGTEWGSFKTHKILTNNICESLTADGGFVVLTKTPPIKTKIKN